MERLLDMFAWVICGGVLLFLYILFYWLVPPTMNISPWVIHVTSFGALVLGWAFVRLMQIIP